MQQLRARGDDALARLGGPLAPQGVVVAPPRRRGRVLGHGTVAGSVSHPRTVEVGDSFALAHVDLPLGEPAEHLVEGDAALEAGRARRPRQKWMP